jgi:RND family efflux transporter MFP subunit
MSRTQEIESVMTHRILMLILFTLTCSPLQAAGDLLTETARLATIPRTYQFDGAIEATQQSTISAQTQGQITEILVDVDDFVEQGSVIIRLKDTEQRAHLAQVRAELNAATAQLQEVQKEHKRTQEIFARKLVAQSAMDKVIANLKSAKARQEAATAALSQAEEQLTYTEVRAPYSGIVTERLIELGETASPGQRLVSGISLELLRVSVEIPQSLIADIRKQAKAQVILPDNRVTTAETITIFPFADPSSGTFKVRLKLPTGIDHLFPGMLVKAMFEIGQKEALLIPASSVVYRSEVTAVYVVDEDKHPVLRHIQVGQKRNGDRITVLSGLEAGENVALDPVKAGSLLMLQSKGTANE